MEALIKLGAICFVLAVVTGIWLVASYTANSRDGRISFGLIMLLVFMVCLVSILAWKW